MVNSCYRYPLRNVVQVRPFRVSKRASAVRAPNIEETATEMVGAAAVILWESARGWWDRGAVNHESSIAASVIVNYNARPTFNRHDKGNEIIVGPIGLPDEHIRLAMQVKMARRAKYSIEFPNLTVGKCLNERRSIPARTL